MVTALTELTFFVKGRKNEVKEWKMILTGKREEETIMEEYGECIVSN
jgi:hypothetical protein